MLNLQGGTKICVIVPVYIVRRTGKLVLNNKIEEILSKHSKEYAQEIQKYLNKYKDSLFDSPKINVSFDVEHAFAMGMAGLAAIGASGAWLALADAAWMVGLFGFEAGLGAVAAVFGAVGIIIGGIILGVIAIIKGVKWKESFAKSIIKSYEKNNFLEKINTSIEKYWEDTRISFTEGAKSIEREAEKKMKATIEKADEANLPKLQRELEIYVSAKSYYDNIILPDDIFQIEGGVAK